LQTPEKPENKTSTEMESKVVSEKEVLVDVETTSENHCDIVQNITQAVDSMKIETLQQSNQVRCNFQ
jgi:hypothetical protein